PVVATVAVVRGAAPMVGEALVAPVVRAGMTVIVRAVVSVTRVTDRVVRVVMMTGLRVVRVETAMIVRAVVSVTRVIVRVVRVVMMTGLRAGRSVTTTVHRGRNANPGRRRSVASVR
ncbi:MAG: hypothetical protein RJA47_1637, partial [Actinomycetota bacterium]